MQLAKSQVLVTGGASGAGRATAERLAKLGAKVVIFDMNDKGQTLADEINGLFFKLDLTKFDDVEAAFSELKGAEPLRVAVNCAGIATPERMTGKDGPKPMDHFHHVIHVNLLATYNIMRLSAAQMSAQSPDEDNQRGVIINTASIAAYEGQIGQTAYSASKAGIVGMTLPAAREMAKFGVRVMTIAPGLLDTPMLQGLPAEYRQVLEENTPFPKRFGKVEEFASLVEHIVMNPMLNGETIRLDGALRMQPA